MTREHDPKTKNPMHEARQALERHPMCGAYARTTEKPCRNPAMKNGRCRMHGGKSKGRPIIHGMYTKEQKAKHTNARALLKELNDLLNGL